MAIVWESHLLVQCWLTEKNAGHKQIKCVHNKRQSLIGTLSNGPFERVQCATLILGSAIINCINILIQSRGTVRLSIVWSKFKTRNRILFYSSQLLNKIKGHTAHSLMQSSRSTHARIQFIVESTNQMKWTNKKKLVPFPLLKRKGAQKNGRDESITSREREKRDHTAFAAVEGKGKGNTMERK